MKKDENLYLNIIDPAQPLFMPQLFTEFILFAREKWDAGKNILIHCNQGESRAPSLGLFFLAKIVRAIPNDSYENARQEYCKIDNFYNPGRGIQTYLSKNWRSFDNPQ